MRSFTMFRWAVQWTLLIGQLGAAFAQMSDCNNKPLWQCFYFSSCESCSIDAIELQDRQLSGSLPSKLGFLTNLRFLCVLVLFVSTLARGTNALVLRFSSAGVRHRPAAACAHARVSAILRVQGPVLEPAVGLAAELDRVAVDTPPPVRLLLCDLALARPPTYCGCCLLASATSHRRCVAAQCLFTRVPVILRAQGPVLQPAVGLAAELYRVAVCA